MSAGIDIDTGGHLFQLVISNSQRMYDQALYTNTTGDWTKGNLFFGFNLIREFNLKYDPPNNNTSDIVVDLNHADFAALKTVGGYAYKGDIIIIRTGDATYIALSKICTHNQCTVTYSHVNGDLPCPCHGSKFTTTGAVKMGPAASGLKSYSVKKEGDTLKLS